MSEIQVIFTMCRETYFLEGISCVHVSPSNGYGGQEAHSNSRAGRDFTGESQI
jgi:hypothetical protein